MCTPHIFSVLQLHFWGKKIIFFCSITYFVGMEVTRVLWSNCLQWSGCEIWGWTLILMW